MPSLPVVLGYGGSAFVNSTQLLITGGSFDHSSDVSYLNMINTPPSNARAGRTTHADGTNAYSGSLDFDVHQDALLDLFRTTGGLLERFWEFDVTIHDGRSQWKMTDCKLQSVSIAGAVGGLLSAQMSYIAKTGKAVGTSNPEFYREEVPLGYWTTGSSTPGMIREWSLAMTQDAELVYKNEDSMEPDYIKVGLVNYTLQVTTYSNLASALDVILISTASFTLTGHTTGSGFSFGGVTDLGSYRYTFETASPDENSDTLVIV